MTFFLFIPGSEIKGMFVKFNDEKNSINLQEIYFIIYFLYFPTFIPPIIEKNRFFKYFSKFLIKNSQT